MTQFQPFFNPSTSEWIEYTTVPESADTAGDHVLRFNWRSMPGGTIPEHTHPHQEERFTISAGEAHFTLNGTPRVLHAGDAIVVPAGVRHSQKNPGSVPIEGVVELRPALQSRQIHEAFAGLATEGRTAANGAPKNLLQLGATLWHFRHESRVASPPPWLQNIILPPLAVAAKVFHLRAHHDRWNSQLG